MYDCYDIRFLCRLIVILDFKQNDEGKYIIHRHEDFLDPGEVIKAFIPYLSPIVNAAKEVATYSTVFSGWALESVGWA